MQSFTDTKGINLNASYFSRFLSLFFIPIYFQNNLLAQSLLSDEEEEENGSPTHFQVIHLEIEPFLAGQLQYMLTYKGCPLPIKQ